MIPQDFITEWKRHAPWPQNDQVEQDLIISRAMVEIFSHPLLMENLAFRGGTALYKLHIPAIRYSEDIDLVQANPGPIGPVMDALQEKLNNWLGKPAREQSDDGVTLKYRMVSEEALPMRLKVEINSREHFSVLGLERRRFDVSSRWFSGGASILTYKLDELLGTKVRALYQRKKGRDLFDLLEAFRATEAQPKRVITCFLRYMEHEGHKVSRAEFEKNLLEKLDDPRFLQDIKPLLISGNEWNHHEAAEYVMSELVALIPGEPWRGKKKEKKG